MICQIVSEATRNVVAEMATEEDCDNWFNTNDPDYRNHFHRSIKGD